MSTTHHTAITTGAAANAATVNSPLGELDAAIVAVDLTEGGNIDGVLTVGELSPTAGVVASFGGPIEVTDGSSCVEVAISDGRIIPKREVGLYGASTVNLAHNSATDVLRIQGSGENFIQIAFLLTLGLLSNSSIKTAIYAVSSAFTTESVSLLNSNIYGGGALTVTAVAATGTSGTITINITQTNTSSESVIVKATITPLLTTGQLSLTMLI